MKILQFIIMALIIGVVSSPSWSMRTPPSPVKKTLDPLGTKLNSYEYEALMYRQEILRFEENRIFFLIQPYIQTRMRMG